MVRLSVDFSVVVVVSVVVLGVVALSMDISVVVVLSMVFSDGMVCEEVGSDVVGLSVAV
jgi:hypothetical protein